MNKTPNAFKKITQDYRQALKAYKQLMRESENWSDEQLTAAQAEWEVAGGNRFGEEQPLLTCGIARALKKLGEQYSAGDAGALLEALHRVILYEIPAPDWLIEPVEAAFSKLNNYEARTMDEAFGYSLPKHAKLPKLRKKKALGVKLFIEVIRRNKGYGEGLTDKLFDEIGQELGMSKTATSELYYELKREWPEKDQRLLEWFAYEHLKAELSGVRFDDLNEDDEDDFRDSSK